MTTTNRHILHMDLDTFFVSAERLQNKQLHNKPVIIGGFSDRAVVASCSYETRAFGVHAGMPVKMALNLCKEAIVIRGDMDLYVRYSNMVTQIIKDKAPLYEKTSVDEFYLDLTGMDRFYGTQKWAHELRMQIIKNTGLPISMGLSLNKTVSKIATGEAKPNGEKQIENNLVIPFLAPLSIRKIPGVGVETFRTLRIMGISTIKNMQELPLDLVKQSFGKNGEDIWRKANGIDFSPVKPYFEQKSMSTEQTFETDTTNYTRLQELITVMTEKLAHDLRNDQKLTSNIAVKIRYSDFDTHTKQKQIKYTALDHELTPVARALFEQLYNRRLLVRLIGVKFSGLVHGFQQLDLFDPNPERIKLYQAMDRLKNMYGEKILRKGIDF